MSWTTALVALLVLCAVAFGGVAIGRWEERASQSRRRIARRVGWL